MEARDYSGAADLRLMQELTAECWRLEGPYVIATIGDLPWWMYQHLDKLDEARVRLWLEGDRCLAWGWLEGGLIFLVHPEHRDLLADVLDWAGADEVTALEHDTAATEALVARGYVLDESRWFDHMTRPLEDLPSRVSTRALRYAPFAARRICLRAPRSIAQRGSRPGSSQRAISR